MTPKRTAMNYHQRNDAPVVFCTTGHNSAPKKIPPMLGSRLQRKAMWPSCLQLPHPLNRYCHSKELTSFYVDSCAICSASLLQIAPPSSSSACFQNARELWHRSITTRKSNKAKSDYILPGRASIVTIFLFMTQQESL